MFNAPGILETKVCLHYPVDKLSYNDYKPEYASRVLNYILLKVFGVYSIKFVQLKFLSLNRIEANN
jgi:hypothetical protein